MFGCWCGFIILVGVCGWVGCGEGGGVVSVLFCCRGGVVVCVVVCVFLLRFVVGCDAVAGIGARDC